MRVSHYELHATCRRAFEGMGFPEGVDEDAAYMISWSELQGLHGLEHLAASLHDLDGCSSGQLKPLVRHGQAVRLDSGGQSVLATCPSALDLAVVLAGERSSAVVNLCNCRDQVFAVAMAVKSNRERHHIRLRWRSGDQVYSGDTHTGARISSVAVGDIEPIEENVLQISVSSTPGENTSSPEGEPQWSMSAERARAVLATGIEVPDELWAALLRYGRRMLVPATAESRERGAGGGDANE